MLVGFGSSCDDCVRRDGATDARDRNGDLRRSAPSCARPATATMAVTSGGTMVWSPSSTGGRHGFRTVADRAGRRRSPATTSTFHQGVSPGNKGLRYPPDPPTVEEIIAVMRAAGSGLEGVRLRGLMVVLWRAGLRISEALALNETDLDSRTRARCLCDTAKATSAARSEWTAGRGRTSNHGSGCERTLPVGRLFCVVRGPTRGRPCAPARHPRAAARHRARGRASAGGSRRISSGTRTRSRCRVRGSR